MADRAYLERLSRELTDQGLLIEAGWIGMRLAVIPDNAPPDQLREMKMAFFAGAQHLYSSMMTIMDPGEKETDADLASMESIHNELEKFGKEFELRATQSKGSA